MASILVFCGSAKGQNPAFEKAGRDLGKLIGNNGHALITGGGAVGLMGVVADSAMEHGAHVTGIIPASSGVLGKLSIVLRISFLLGLRVLPLYLLESL